MDDRSRVLMATLMGAVAGGICGLAYLTEPGRRMRSQIEPKLDDFMRELSNVRGTVEKAGNGGERGVAIAQRDRRGRNAGPLVRRKRQGEPMVDLHTTNVLLGVIADDERSRRSRGAGSRRRGLHRLQEGPRSRSAGDRDRVEANCAAASQGGRDSGGRQDGDGAGQRTDRTGRPRYHGTMDRVDETAERVRSSVQGEVATAVGVVRGVRAIHHVDLHPQANEDGSAAAAGRAY